MHVYVEKKMYRDYIYVYMYINNLFIFTQIIFQVPNFQ